MSERTNGAVEDGAVRAFARFHRIALHRVRSKGTGTERCSKRRSHDERKKTLHEILRRGVRWPQDSLSSALALGHRVACGINDQSPFGLTIKPRFDGSLSEMRSHIERASGMARLGTRSGLRLPIWSTTASPTSCARSTCDHVAANVVPSTVPKIPSGPKRNSALRANVRRYTRDQVMMNTAKTTAIANLSRTGPYNFRPIWLDANDHQLKTNTRRGQRFVRGRAACFPNAAISPSVRSWLMQTPFSSTRTSA